MIVVHLHCGVGTFATRTGVKTLGWLQKTSTVLFSCPGQLNKVTSIMISNWLMTLMNILDSHHDIDESEVTDRE